MTIKISTGKVRGFIFQGDGSPASSSVVTLEAELDNGLWQRVGVLAADHAGFVSFSLAPLRAGGRASVMSMRVRTADAVADIAAHTLLDAAAPAFVLTSSAGGAGSALTAIQEPDDFDRAASPGSFATPPTMMIGDDDCAQLIPSGLAGFDYGMYRVLRLGGFNNSGNHELNPKLKHEFNPQLKVNANSLSDTATVFAAAHAKGAVNMATALSELALPDVGVQVGLVLRYSQRWSPIGQSLGDIVYSLPLAPGEEDVPFVVEVRDGGPGVMVRR